MEERLRVLIVDDDQVDRQVVRRALKQAGMIVDYAEAENCQQAIAALSQDKFDGIFVDYRLPDQDGLALVQTIRRQQIQSPIVVLTGQGDEQIAVDLMKAGASDYLSKSRISPEALAQVLRNAIRIARAEAEMALQRADFIAHLTHDLRTPLVAADMMLKLFQAEAFGQLPAAMQTPLTALLQSNQNLLDMVNTLLEVHCYEAGEKNLTLITCDLWEISHAIIQELRPLAQSKGIELTHTRFSRTPKLGELPELGEIAKLGEVAKLEEPTKPGEIAKLEEPAKPGEIAKLENIADDDPLLVLGDCQEIRRMITNLVANSIKFTEVGRVELRLGVSPARPEDLPTVAGWVMVDVQDTGLGMSSDEQATIFQRYRKGNHTQSGSGLGLHLVERIVSVHKGTIRVSSIRGQGSLFTIHLPLHSPAAPECAAPECAAPECAASESPCDRP
jgi:two-component system, sensor histidine kinase and response regulator